VNSIEETEQALLKRHKNWFSLVPLELSASPMLVFPRRFERPFDLGHWVGDIHQPLHVSFEEDRGGNDIRVSGCSKNLHAVWDNCLVEYAVGLDVPKAVAALMQTITPEMQVLWASSSPKDWANETFALAKAPSTRYCVMHDQSCDRPTEKLLTITNEYIETNKPVVREQFQKAGVRLAYILDAALGN
jgi:hypothetical protein